MMPYLKKNQKSSKVSCWCFTGSSIVLLEKNPTFFNLPDTHGCKSHAPHGRHHFQQR